MAGRSPHPHAINDGQALTFFPVPSRTGLPWMNGTVSWDGGAETPGALGGCLFGLAAVCDVLT